MATRLERESILREKAQLQARLDQLFAAQERQTAGKKRSSEFCRGGRVRKRRRTLGGAIDPELAQDTIFGSTNPGGFDYAGPSLFGGAGTTGINPMAAQNAVFPGGGPQVSSGFGLFDVGNIYNPSGGGGGGFGNFLSNLFPQGGRNLMQGLGTAASFAGPAYDIGRGLSRPVQFNPQDFYNPQYGRAISEYNRGIGLMRGRRYDPRAELEDVERTGAVYRQQIKNLPTSLGALYNRLASQVSREQRRKGQILTKKQNIDLGLRGEEAQFRAGAARGFGALGSERARTKFSIADYNERAAAQRRNMLAAGLSGLGMGAQTQQLMANQRMRDAQLAGILPSYGGGLYNYGPQGGVQFGGQGMTPEEWQRYIRGY
jgi:hypothetical protein